MSNKYRAIVDIEFEREDKEPLVTQLKYDWNALATFETMYGLSVSKAIEEQGVGFRMIRDLFYVGLIWNKGLKATPNAVGNLLSPSKMKYYSDKVMEALNFLLGDLRESVQSAEEEGEQVTVEKTPVEKAPTTAEITST